MPSRQRILETLAPVITLAMLGWFTASLLADERSLKAEDSQETAPSDDKPAFETQRLRGKVVWLAAALKSEFGISTVPEAAEQSLAILTTDGELIPIVENFRGRAFRVDQRLREMDVEILARRHQRQPLIQVLRLYQIDGEKRYEVDYWCDVCAIVMFEKGPCSCCQDDNRLRKRLVESTPPTPGQLDSPSSTPPATAPSDTSPR